MKKEIISCAFVSMFTEAEREVAAILLDLPRLFAESEYPFRPRIESSWGAKRRRSADENPLQRRLSLLSSSSSQAPLLVPCPNKTVTTAIVAPTLEPERPTVKVEASSPATPLSFPPSESDERPKRKRKASFKKVYTVFLLFHVLNSQFLLEVLRFTCFGIFFFPLFCVL